MRQLTFIRPGHLEWWDVPTPRITSPDQALVEPVVVASCDLDAPILRGEAPFVGPFAFGHECIAKVVDIGEDVHAVTPGQFVVVPFQISCGTCRSCQQGKTANCTSVPRFSWYGLGGKGAWGGALSDLLRVPFADHMLVPVPQGISLETIASASDNLPDAWRTIGPYLEALPGSPVLIIGGAGSGSIGLYIVTIAHALGASQVDYVDWDAGRLEIASALGAHIIEGATALRQRLGPYPITVDAGANPDGLACALRSTAPEGVCTSTGVYFAPATPVPLREMHTIGLTFKTGHSHARANIPAILSLISDARIHPERVTTEVAHWDDALEALSHFRTKLVITREMGIQ